MNGLIHYYYGYGKGKTTAALGLMTRALGHGMRVVLVQFLKDEDSGEIHFFQDHPHVTILRSKAGTGMPWDMGEQERQETLAVHNRNLQEAQRIVQSGQCDLLVLDEVSDAVQLGLLNKALLLSFLQNKPNVLEIVMTGHKPLQCCMKIADYVTRMEKKRHPFDSGIDARIGIER